MRILSPLFLAASLPAFATATASAEKATEIDYLKVAVDFAECMIQHGRDRYGRVHSPLFSNILTREKEPKLTPYPLFADPARESRDMKTPFRRFDFNKVLNYPRGMGTEGPHKVTLFGCDPYEDAEFYRMLFDLTRITGEPRYEKEAEKALTWWFRNTQGPTGLYPWGEHMGWDFVYDCPSYFDGPSKYLYAASYHEVKDNVPFLDILARLPAEKPDDDTPLEKYALGIWNAHFWDQEKAYFDRHGDYAGEDDRNGCTGGFPAHLAAYLHVWAEAYLNSERPEFRRKMEEVFHKVLDMAVARTEKYGFFPFTFDPELHGRDPEKDRFGQPIRLAHESLDVALQIEKANPQVAAKLRKLAELNLGPEEYRKSVRKLEMRRQSEAEDHAEPRQSMGPKPRIRIKDLSRSRTSSEYGAEIVRYVDLYRQYGDKAYLDAAETYGRLAYLAFCDDKSPLPRARPGSGAYTTAEGKPFPDFYFHGGGLMHAFARLGEAKGKDESHRPGGNREDRKIGQ